MSQENSHRLRWKGTVSGPHPASRIAEMLRAGEISLAHGVESEGRWMTVREFLRGGRAPREFAPARSQSADHAAPASADAEVSERQQTDDSIERSVREGYLWCGSTFLLPPAFGLLVWLWVQAVPETQPISRFVLLAFCAALGCLLPVAMVRRVGAVLEQEGLGELRQAQGRLSVMLAGLGFVFWLAMFWFLKGGS